MERRGEERRGDSRRVSGDGLRAKTLETTSREMLKEKSQWGGTPSPLRPDIRVRARERL